MLIETLVLILVFGFEFDTGVDFSFAVQFDV